MPNSQKTFQTLVFGHEEVLVLYSKIYHFFGFWDFCHVFKGCPIFPQVIYVFLVSQGKSNLYIAFLLLIQYLLSPMCSTTILLNCSASTSVALYQASLKQTSVKNQT